jgi:hypothetical protein
VPISEAFQGDYCMEGKPKYPWRFDTNERYREVVRLILSLSTASLLLPIFFAREFLSISDAVALKSVFSCWVYVSWTLLVISIMSGIKFHFLSAKWIRLAWGKSASILGKGVTDSSVECMLNVAFWSTMITFILGVGSIMIFLVNYVPNS